MMMMDLMTRRGPFRTSPSGGNDPTGPTKESGAGLFAATRALFGILPLAQVN